MPVLSKRLLFSFTLAVALESQAVVDLKTSLACLAGISKTEEIATGVKPGSLFYAGQDSALVPDLTKSKKGFYLYTSTSAYFCKFPEQTSYVEGAYKRYYLEFNLPDQGESKVDRWIRNRTGTFTKDTRWVTFEETTEVGSPPRVVIENNPTQMKKEVGFRKIDCKAELSDETKTNLAVEVQKRIESGYPVKWTQETVAACDKVTFGVLSSDKIDYKLRVLTSCYKESTGHPGTKHVLQNGSILLPTVKKALTKKEKDVPGYYVYGNDKIHFCALPEKPRTKAAKKQGVFQYNFKLHLPPQAPVWMSYADQTVAPELPIVTTDASPTKDIEYMDASCKEETTPEAKLALTEDIKQRYASESIKSANTLCNLMVNKNLPLQDAFQGAKDKIMNKFNR